MSTRDYMLAKGARDFFHTGLNIARSELKGLMDGQNPFVKMYVAKWGSDSDDGSSWDRAFATIAKAISVNNAAIDWGLTVWDSLNREIHIAPGLYAEALTSMPHGSSLLGHGNAMLNSPGRGVWICPVSGSPIDCTSILSVVIDNIVLRAPSDNGTEALIKSGTFNNSMLSRCYLRGVTGSTTTTHGFQVTTEMNESTITGCKIRQARNGIHLAISGGKQISYSTIEWTNIMESDLIGIHFSTTSAPSGTIINHCNVGESDQTLALGLDDNSDLVEVFNSNFEAAANDPATGSGRYNNCQLNGVDLT